MAPVFRKLKVTTIIGDCFQEDRLDIKPIQPRPHFLLLCEWSYVRSYLGWIEERKRMGLPDLSQNRIPISAPRNSEYGKILFSKVAERLRVRLGSGY